MVKCNQKKSEVIHKNERNTETADFLEGSSDSTSVENVIDTKKSSNYISEIEIISINTDTKVADHAEHSVIPDNVTNIVINEETILETNAIHLTNLQGLDYKELNKKLALINISNIATLKETGEQEITNTITELRFQILLIAYINTLITYQMF